MQMLVQFPVKVLLQDLPRKGPFFLHLSKIMRDLARSGEILWDFAGILCNIPARFLQGCKKKDLFFEDFARAFLLGLPPLYIVKWHPLLGFGSTKLP